MRLQEDIDFTTLNWVKGELDETLKLARHALEAYISDPSDVSQMRFCATYLHQVQGTLRMVELYGAALVTEEMEQLAAAVQEQQVSAPEMAFEVLMDGIVQLPDYLERLQSGQKDIPVVLLPLLNRLRASRGEAELTESALFAPDITCPMPLCGGSEHRLSRSRTAAACQSCAGTVSGSTVAVVQRNGTACQLAAIDRHL